MSSDRDVLVLSAEGASGVEAVDQAVDQADAADELVAELQVDADKVLAADELVKELQLPDASRDGLAEHANKRGLRAPVGDLPLPLLKKQNKRRQSLHPSLPPACTPSTKADLRYGG